MLNCSHKISVVTEIKGENLRHDVSKENNLGPGDKIRYICGLKDPIYIL